MNLIIIAVLFSLKIPLTIGLSFNFSSFGSSPDDTNIFYENAYPAIEYIQLTFDQTYLVEKTSTFGRATYYKPLQLWDKASGNLTDFSTHFSFSIDSKGHFPPYGDGMVFFLAPEGSMLPSSISQGGTLGLTRDNQQLNTTENCFVAVEFDVFKDYFDPENEHVGINVNSMQSVSSNTWKCNIVEGSINHAWISYDSRTYNLSVIYMLENATELQYLSLIVDLREYLPENVTFGFSGATGFGFSGTRGDDDLPAVNRIYSWTFSTSLSAPEQVIDPITPGFAVSGPSPSEESNPNHNLSRKKGTSLEVWLAGGFALLAGGLCLVWLVIMFWKRLVNNAQGDELVDGYMDDEFRRGIGPKKFPYHRLVRATSNFKDEAKLGEGGFGAVYKGFLKETNLFVAVKKVSRGSKQGPKEYAAEVQIISRLRHRNLVQLIGWCHERKDLLLVYEFMSNGSLDSHLFKMKKLLTWDVRYRIAQGLASGLLYLHEGWEKCVVHRDVKSSNIMLDSEFTAKLGDFGLARLVDHGKGVKTTMLAGTMGYMAPECATTGKASRESDIYSFGVVALELACGRKPIIPDDDGGQLHLVEWVWELYGKGKLLEAVDPRLHGDFDGQQMVSLMTVGLWCAHPDANLRPSIKKSINVLNFEAPLPILPPNMPVPMYVAPVVVNFSSLTNSEGV